MWKLTKRISLRTSSVLPKVEPELDLYAGFSSDQKVPTPAPQRCSESLLAAVNVKIRKVWLQLYRYR